MATTLIDKIWDDHVIADFGDGDHLLHVDRHWLNDAGYHALAELDRRGLEVHSPQLTLAVVDHLVQTTAGRTYASSTPFAEEWALGIREGCRRHGLRFIDLDDPRHGITHVISPEMGVTLPGSLMVCTDSHTCTNGAFGAFACGVGSFGATQVLATQTIVLRRPQTLRVWFDGALAAGVTPKDLALHLIGAHGTAGGLGYAIEYAGPLVEGLDMPARMTMCNLGAEFGATTTMVAPDETTFAFLEGREFSPAGHDWDDALTYWGGLHSDPDASFDRELTVDASTVAPQVTWGTSPAHVAPVDGVVPDPVEAGQDVPSRQRALEYMGLTPGQHLEGLPLDAAFIGSCTNARLEDLRAAATVLHGQRVAPGVQATCVPGSAAVKRAAEVEGLDEVFTSAGFRWGEAGCSLCMSAIDGPPPGSRVITSTNRSSEARMGPGVRTHLASPATVAASAIAGVITDVRRVEVTP